MTQAPDVCIVGAGIIGLSCAYELLRRGLRVTLIERGAAVGQGASWVAGGMLAPTGEAEVAPLTLNAFSYDSLQRYPEFLAQLQEHSSIDVGLRREGMLSVALTQADAADLRHFAAILQKKNMAAHWLSADALRAREAALSTQVQGGLWVPNDWQVDPRALIGALHDAVIKLGGNVMCNTRVSCIFSDEQVVVGMDLHRDGAVQTVHARTVVIAAGAWSTALLSSPLQHLSVRPVKGQLLRLHGPVLLQHIIRTPDVYIIPRRNGELLIGATVEEQGFNMAPTAGAVYDLLRHAWRVLPGIEELELRECAVGLRPAVADHLPVIGASHIAGLFAATGHFRDGVLLAPATAHYLAEWIVSNQAPAALAPFSPARFTTPFGDESQCNQPIFA